MTIPDLVVLGIDPGLAATGWGVVEGRGQRRVWRAHGCIDTTPRTGELLDRIRYITDSIQELVKEYRPDIVAVERWVVYGQSDSTQAHNIGLVIGSVIGRLSEHRSLGPGCMGSDLKLDHRAQDWRLKLGLSARATKPAVQLAVQQRLGLLKIPRPQHAADALAVALAQDIWFDDL